MSDLLLANPAVSFIITAHGQSRLLAQTLPHIQRCGLPPEQIEILLVDRNGPEADDSLSDERFPLVRMMVLADSPRMHSFRDALSLARGRYILLLEDDSYPRPGSVARMIMHFEQRPNLAAAVFTVTGADGMRCPSVYPNIIRRCGTGLRRRCLDVHAAPDDLLLPTAEYDLSLQLIEAGWELDTFDDLHVSHDAHIAADPTSAVSHDVRDSLLVLTRFFPQKWILPFARDWMKRQRLLASTQGQETAYYRGLLAGLAKAMSPRNRRPVTQGTFESLVRLRETENRLQQAKAHYGLERILLLDYSPNILAFHIAARKCGLQVVGIADAKFASPCRRYRSAPIVDDQTALSLAYNAAVLTSLHPAEAMDRAAQWRRLDNRPVIDLFNNVGSTAFTFAARESSEARRTAVRIA